MPELRASEGQFNDAFERYWLSVFRFALAWTNDWQSAEDLAQEAFIRLWAKRADIDWSGQPNWGCGRGLCRDSAGLEPLCASSVGQRCRRRAEGGRTGVANRQRLPRSRLMRVPHRKAVIHAGNVGVTADVGRVSAGNRPFLNLCAHQGWM